MGIAGDGPGQFDLVHGVAVDRDRRVYVADRTNNRMQVFTEKGKFIEEWPDITDPVGVYIDETNGVWVVSAALNRILKYNRDGVLQYYWGAYGGTSGGFAGGLSRPHQIDVDQEGNVYIASWDGGWVTKYVPKMAGSRQARAKTHGSTEVTTAAETPPFDRPAGRWR